MMKTLFLRLEKWRWVVLAIIGLSLLWVEIEEFLTLRILNQGFHYFEVFQYAVLLISTGLLLELFARSNKAHKQAVKILENKHRISLELANQDDWESLLNRLTVIPSEIADVEETYLLLTDPLTGEFESVGHWLKQSSVLNAPVWDPSTTCAVCVKKPASGRTFFHVCQDGEGLSGDYVYCLEVSHQNIPTALLKFRVHQESVLSPEEEEIFSSIRDEIIVAIQSSQDRRRLSEMQWAEVAIAERRMVSTYVHDQLGQNLGYLHLKLDQLSNGEGGSAKELRAELNRLREVANESYEIVRDILKKMQPETIPHLTNLLQEHARTVSRRSKFALDFKSIGKPRNLPADIQQTIFFTFREVLSNVEKHALANRVDVLIVWEKDTFDISVSDNGRGFDAAAVQSNEHFGLDIMRERISNVMGKLTVQSSQDLGTVVSITIPLGMMKEVSA